MKICPNCQRTYTDDGLNFCLDDGAILSQTTTEQMPPTVMMNPPRSTNPNTSFGNEPQQGNWNNPAPYTMQPQKSSKTWLWVVGILGGLVLLCGGGFVGFVAWVGSLETNNNSTNDYGSRNGNTSNIVNASATPEIRTNVSKIDLSEWVIANSEFGITEFTNGELTMSSKKKGFYYVIAGTEKEKSENATSSVKVKNIDNANSALGFGLVVHSQTIPLKQGYGFLIDSVKKRYRVVYHEPGKETAAVNWTNSAAIKDGTVENNLEVRDADGKMDFYINGTLITSVKNLYGFKGGVVGLYSGDAAKIVFSNLEIKK